MRRFTILLAAHDRLELLQQAVTSALAAVGPNDEVLVVDDGSGATTVRWLDEQAIGHAALRVVHQPNQGVASARKRGVEEAAGELIFILDSDDQVVAGALDAAAEVFAERPDTDLVYGDNLHVYDDGTTHRRRYKQYPSNHRFLWATFLSPRVPFKHSGTVFRRAVALELGNYDDTLPIKIDIDFYLRFMHADRTLVHLDAPLVSFRVHRAMMSRNRRKGIPIWSRLIDRYGPRNPLKRAFAKFVRGTSERLKAVWERLRR